MPSKKSLEQQQYYGNPRNHFWPIMFTIMDREPADTYEEKIAFIKSCNIALWDTIKACYREGSLDSNITDAEPNDIHSLLTNHPSIRLIACNGTKSFQTFKQNISLATFTNIDVLKLPSTSPIPGRYTKTFAGKVEEWKKILNYL